MAVTVQWSPVGGQGWNQVMQDCNIPQGPGTYGDLLRVQIEIWAEVHVLNLNHGGTTFFGFSQNFVNPPCAQRVEIFAIRRLPPPQGGEIVEIRGWRLSSPD
jgi:hypothetical protein